ncbi:MAG: hypothetical protein E7479_07180 [Ruminococcaceae bacterium]|nr:hypothetical protein [Oscillospiraceae bacterium]
MDFSVLKIKVSVSPLFFSVLTTVLLLDKTGVSGFAVLFSLLHELGHILALLCGKIKPKEFRLSLFGIHIRLPGNLSTGEKCLVLMSGFMLNYIFAVLFFVFREPIFGYINLLIGIFTSLPLPSTDGGEILKTVLEEFLPKNGGEVFGIVSGIFALIFSVLLIVLFVITKNYFILIAVIYIISCAGKRAAR